MQRWHQFVLTVAVIALIVSPVSAQRRPGGGGAGMVSQLALATQKSVQEELKLTPDQVEKLSNVYRKQMASRQGLRDLEDAERNKKLQEMNKEGDQVVSETLKADQAKRLKQILYQQLGVQAFNRPEVATELKITDAQKQKFQDLQANLNKERGKLFQPGAGGQDREAMQKKMAELTKKTNEDALAVLTPEQKEGWKKLTGEPFKGEIRLGPGGGGRRQGNRPPADK